MIGQTCGCIKGGFHPAAFAPIPAEADLMIGIKDGVFMFPAGGIGLAPAVNGLKGGI